TAPPTLDDAEALGSSGTSRRTRRLSPSTDSRIDANANPELEIRRTRRGDLLVRPRIDGRAPGWFAFDTGSSGHIISTKMARDLGLKPVAVGLNRSLSGTVESTVWQARRMTLGPLTVRAPRFTGTDLSFLSSKLGVDVAGVIGCEAFSKCVVDLDYRGGSIALFDPDTYDRGKAKWRRLYSITGRPCIRAKFEGHRGLMLIDTGSDGAATFYPHAVRRYGLLELRKTHAARSAGMTGHSENRVGTLDWIAFAGRRFHDVPGVLFSTGASRLRPGERTPAGHLGCRLLMPFKIVLDWQRRRVAFIRHERVEVDRDILDDYVGTYRIAEGDRREVRRDGHRLFTRRNEHPSFEVFPESDTRFYYADSLVYCQFIRGDAGRVTHMVVCHPGIPDKKAPKMD
ncbi:MAG: aspartyl protease family protein, partial [Planctomycetota bacterium]|nr:aspartyl protease family protein [Planctomycetota bacterium]